MLRAVGLKTVHGMKWEIAVSDQNSGKALQALTFISCCYTLTLFSNQRWLPLDGRGLQNLWLLSGEEFILIASEKVGMISIKIKNLQIHLSLGSWPSVHPQEELVSAAASWLEVFQKKPKALRKPFLSWQAGVAPGIKAWHMSWAWKKWRLDTNDDSCQSSVW